MQRIDFNDPQAVNELCVGFVQSLLQDGGMAPEQAESAAKALGDVVLCLMAHYKQKDARRARDLFEVDRRRFCADYIVSRTGAGISPSGQHRCRSARAVEGSGNGSSATRRTTRRGVTVNRLGQEWEKLSAALESKGARCTTATDFSFFFFGASCVLEQVAEALKRAKATKDPAHFLEVLEEMRLEALAEGIRMANSIDALDEQAKAAAFGQPLRSKGDAPG